MATLADGIYRFAAKLNHNACMAIPNWSTTAGTNVELWSHSDGNPQKWKVSTNANNSRSFQNVHSSQMLTLPNGLVQNYAVFKQWPSNNTISQTFTIVDAGIENGVQYWFIKYFGNSNYVVDYLGGSTNNANDVVLFQYHGMDSQKWEAIPDTMIDDGMSVPANVGLTTTTTGSKISTPAISSPTTLYPVWMASAGLFQLRYRFRYRRTGKDTYTGWNSFRSPTGVSINDGWGSDPRIQTGSDTGTSNTRHYVDGISYSMDINNYDKIETQIEVRGFDSDDNFGFGETHSVSCTSTIPIYYKPNLTLTSVTYTPDGILIPFVSSFPRNGNSITISIEKTQTEVFLVDSYTADGLGYNDTLSIPIDKINSTIVPGESIRVKASLKTSDGVSFSYTKSDVIDLSTGHGTTVSATFSVTERNGLLVNVPGTYSKVGVWLIINQDGRLLFVEADQQSTGRYVIYPPFNIPYQIYVLTQTSSTSWATKVFDRPAYKVQEGLFQWNYNTDFTSLLLDVDASRTVERDFESYVTTGRYKEVVHFGASSKVSLSCKGVILLTSDIPNSSYSDFERLAMCNYAIYRTSLGKWYKVAVTGVSDSYTWTAHQQVKIDMKEVDV